MGLRERAWALAGCVTVLIVCTALAPAARADSLLYRDAASGTWLIANSDGTNAHPVESPNPQFMAGALGDGGTVHLMSEGKIDNDAPGTTIQSTPVSGVGEDIPYGECSRLADPVVTSLRVSPDGTSFFGDESQLDSCQGDLQTVYGSFIGAPDGSIAEGEAADYYYLDGSRLVVGADDSLSTADPVPLAHGTSTSTTPLTPLASLTNVGLTSVGPPVYSRDGTKALADESGPSGTALFVFLLMPDGSQDFCAAGPVGVGFALDGQDAFAADWSSAGSFVDVQEPDGIHQLTPISASACNATSISDTSAVTDKLVVPGGTEPSLGAGGDPAGFPISAGGTGSGGSGSGGTGSGGTGGGGGSSGPTLGRPSVGRVRVSGVAALVPLSCSAGAACTVRLSLTVVETLTGGKLTAVAASRAKRKRVKKTVVVGAKTVRITAGRRETVKLSLNQTGKKLLRKHNPLKARLTAVDAGRTVARFTLGFKAKKAKK